MNLADQWLNPDPKKLRQFAAGWVFLFGGLALYHYGGRSRPTLALGLAAVAVMGMASWWIAPRFFRWVYVIGILLAFPLGWLSSQLALGLMFYGIITPVALVFRLGRRDRLNLYRPTSVASYWKNKPMPFDVRRYFRPF